MANTEDKGKMQQSDQSQLMGQKPFGTIGPDSDSMAAAKRVLNKLKKKKVSGHLAEGSTSESGETANVASKAISGFANGRK